MAKPRSILFTLFIGTGYILMALVLMGQTLDRRVTILEQHHDNVLMPTVERLYDLEARLYARDISIESRLSSIERSISTFGQLLLAIGAAVILQLVTTAIHGFRSRRSGDSKQRME